MYFEWCSVAVGDTESSASSFLYCISSSSHYAVLPSLLSSNTFIPLHPLTSHTSEQPQPAVFFSQHRISPSSLAVAVSHTLQELGAVALQRGQHHDPAHPALPKQRGWAAQGLLLRHVTSLWGGRPTEPHIQPGIHSGEWQSSVLFGCSKRIMSSLDTN